MLAKTKRFESLKRNDYNANGMQQSKYEWNKKKSRKTAQDIALHFPHINSEMEKKQFIQPTHSMDTMIFLPTIAAFHFVFTMSVLVLFLFVCIYLASCFCFVFLFHMNVSVNLYSDSCFYSAQTDMVWFVCSFVRLSCSFSSISQFMLLRTVANWEKNKQV